MIGIVLVGTGLLFPKKKYINQKSNSSREDDEQTSLPTANLHDLPSADRSTDDIVFPDNTREPDSVTENTTRHLS
jgi:hypothetical protein